MDTAQSLQASAARTRMMYEAVFAVAATLWLLLAVACKLTGLSSRNWVSPAAASCTAASHIGMLYYRRRCPETFWLPVLVGWLDCAMVTLASVEVQTVLWDTLYAPLAMGDRPCSGWRNNLTMEKLIVVDCELSADIQSTFVLCALLSYMTNFVLKFKQGLIVNVVGISMYFSLIIFTRLTIQRVKPDYAGLTMEVFCTVLSTATSMSAKRCSEWLSTEIFGSFFREERGAGAWAPHPPTPSRGWAPRAPLSPQS